MSKIFNRYEHYKTPFGEMIFDRQTHSLLNKETHEVNSNEIKTSPNDVLFAIFPNQILSHIHLPSWLITVSIISSFILFIVLAVLFPKWIYPFQKKDFLACNIYWITYFDCINFITWIIACRYCYWLRRIRCRNWN